MTRLTSVLTAAFIVGVLAAPALAQDVLAKRISLDLKGVAPAQAFKAVADAVGVNVSIDTAVTAPVDILVRGVSAKTALNVMCESVGCRWTLAAGTLSIKPVVQFSATVAWDTAGTTAQGEAKLKRTQTLLDAMKQKLPADMKFENAPLDAVSTRLSEALSLHVQLTCKDPSVRTLTMDFSNLTLQSALQAIATQEDRPKAAWQLMIGPLPGDTQTPSIAIMVGPRGQKKR
jgi:hypothetical protein